MIFYYKAVGYESGETLVTGRYSDCVRHLNKKARSRKEDAHDEPIQILQIHEKLCTGLTNYERALKESFDRGVEEAPKKWDKNDPVWMEGRNGRRVCDWSEMEDDLLLNCRTFKDAAEIGDALGKTAGAVWARVRRIRKQMEKKTC